MHKPIPESVWRLVRSLEDHEAVRRTAAIAKKDGGERQFTIEHDADGYLLISLYQDDCWMLQRPDGSWSECFVADKDCKEYEEGLKKLGRTLVLSADIGDLGRVNVYIP